MFPWNLQPTFGRDSNDRAANFGSVRRSWSVNPVFGTKTPQVWQLNAVKSSTVQDQDKEDHTSTFTFSSHLEEKNDFILIYTQLLVY